MLTEKPVSLLAFPGLTKGPFRERIMFEELKKYLSDYSKEIDEQQPQQEYEKSLRGLWEKNGAITAKILIHLNARYLSLYRIEDIIEDIPEERRKSYKLRVNCVRNGLALVIPGYSLDALKAILSEDYRPPDKTEDTINHLLTLHHLYAYLMPTTPGLSHIIPLKAGYALALLTASALLKSSLADDKGFKGDRFADQTEANAKKAADMLDLISQVCDGLTINKYRTTDGKIKLHSMATEIRKRFKKDEKIKKRLGEIDKRYKNGTKTPTANTIVDYLKEMDL